MPPPDPRRGRRGATRSESLPERATPRKPETAPLWDALHDHGAELVLVGHAHNYERFEPMDSTGAADADSGITEFVVGTGGRSLFPITGPDREDSEALLVNTFGVLELTLSPGAWSSRFIAEPGPARDATAGTCHAPPPP